MLRTFTCALAGGALAVSLAACSAGGGSQNGCSQPPLQQYPVPQLVAPTSGSTNVPDAIGTIQISTTLNVIVGTITLNSSSGTVNVAKATLDPHQPNPNTFLWDLSIPTLKAATTYTVTQSIQYPSGCLGPIVTQTHNIGTFTTQ
ncbi:MAG: hypothetical protein JO043_02225 [Candidatus Eremiobacteraeota bacterium]|nr:hypothetical protein [Candidatus Eremiobacteraeota bacterium]